MRMRTVMCRLAAGLLVGWLARSGSLPDGRERCSDGGTNCSLFHGSVISDVMFGVVVFIPLALHMTPSLRNSSMYSADLVILAFGVVIGAGWLVSMLGGTLAGMLVCLSWKPKTKQRDAGQDSGGRHAHGVDCPTAGWWIRFGASAAIEAWLPPSPLPPELVAVALPFIRPPGDSVQNSERLRQKNRGEHGGYPDGKRHGEQAGAEAGYGPACQHDQTLPPVDVAPISREAAERAEHSEAAACACFADDYAAGASPGQQKGDSVPTLVDEERQVAGDPDEEEFEGDPLDERLDEEDLFPTWQVFAFTVLRLAAIALSVYGGVKVMV